MNDYGLLDQMAFSTHSEPGGFITIACYRIQTPKETGRVVSFFPEINDLNAIDMAPATHIPEHGLISSRAA